MHKDTENKNSDSQYSTQPLGQVLVNGDAAGYSDKNIETKNHQVLIDFLNANIAHGLLPNDNSWLAVAGFKLGRSEIIPAVSYGKYRILMNTKDDGRQLLKVLDNQNGGAELSGPEAIVGLKLLANLVTEFQRQQTGRVS